MVGRLLVGALVVVLVVAGGPGDGLRAEPAPAVIGVWLQDPERNAANFKDVGVTLWVGLWEGPTEAQLAALDAVGLPVIAAQNEVALRSARNRVVVGWMHADEPDAAQPDPRGGYLPCVDPATVHARYQEMKRADPTRPVYLNLSRGVADVDWIGRGECTGRTEMYPRYAEAADILSFDVYPVNDRLPLEVVGQGVENLRRWSGQRKPVWAFIEASNIRNTAQPSPAQINAQVWMAIGHGATGIQYFCHQFSPEFVDDACIRDRTTRDALVDVNGDIRRMVERIGPVFGERTIADGVEVTAPVRIDAVAKDHGAATYVFAVGTEDAPGAATFTLPGATAGRVNVIGEDRTLPMSGGRFRDDFAPYGVHIYKVTGDRGRRA